MKDFDQKLAQFGRWVKKNQGKWADSQPQFQFNLPQDKEKPRCSGEYPYCDTAMLITYHCLTNSRAPRGTIRLQCKICNKGGIVNANQWREDVDKSKKSS